MDPSTRPAADQDVKATTEIVGAVHVLSSELYWQWALVASGDLDSRAVVESLMNASPGLLAAPSSEPDP